MHKDPRVGLGQRGEERKEYLCLPLAHKCVEKSKARQEAEIPRRITLNKNEIVKKNNYLGHDSPRCTVRTV